MNPGESATEDAPVDVAVAHHRVALQTTGVDRPLTLHVVTAGPPDGTPVILLHGFPEFWWGWRHQIPALVAAGYRVIVPDQRGYTTSDKPSAVSAYRVAHLARDVVALQDALCGGAPTHVVGHDWGGAVAWTLAMLHPERVRTLTVLNCPRPRVLVRALLTDPRQLARSWYILFFQLPGIAERQLAAGGVGGALRSTSARGTFSKADLARYDAVATREAMRGALSWYRAAARHRGVDRPIAAPTLLLWGTGDTALGEALAAPSLDTVADGRLERIEGASHWVAHERPDEVNAAILAHLAAHGGADPLVYKIVDAQTWAAVPDAWSGSPDDLRDRFVHLSARSQVASTLDKHFAGQAELRLLGVDPGRLPAGALRWEVSRGGARFPHLHAPLPRHAVVSDVPIGRGADGRAEPPWLRANA